MSPWFDGPPAATDDDRAADKTAARLEREARYADYQKRLLEAATGGEDYRRHLADLLEFHAREGRPQWWEFFDRQTRFEDELLDDTECLAGLTMTGPPRAGEKISSPHLPVSTPGDQAEGRRPSR